MTSHGCVRSSPADDGSRQSEDRAKDREHNAGALDRPEHIAEPDEAHSVAAPREGGEVEGTADEQGDGDEHRQDVQELQDQHGEPLLALRPAGDAAVRREYAKGGAVGAIEGLGQWPRSQGPDMFWFDHEWPALEPGRPLGPVTSVAEDVDGTLYVLGRGRVMDPLIGLAPDGRYLRSVRTWDDGLFEYPHGLRIDAERTLWATDLRRHQALRLSRDGDVLLELGTHGEAGGGDRHLDGPTDVAFAPGGDVLVADGH